MRDEDYIELPGKLADKEWKKKQHGDQLYSRMQERWIPCYDVGDYFSWDYQYRRPKPTPAESEHFI